MPTFIILNFFQICLKVSFGYPEHRKKFIFIGNNTGNIFPSKSNNTLHSNLCKSVLLLQTILEINHRKLSNASRQPLINLMYSRSQNKSRTPWFIYHLTALTVLSQYRFLNWFPSGAALYCIISISTRTSAFGLTLRQDICRIRFKLL